MMPAPGYTGPQMPGQSRPYASSTAGGSQLGRMGTAYTGPQAPWGSAGSPHYPPMNQYGHRSIGGGIYEDGSGNQYDQTGMPIARTRPPGTGGGGMPGAPPPGTPPPTVPPAPGPITPNPPAPPTTFPPNPTQPPQWTDSGNTGYQQPGQIGGGGGGGGTVGQGGGWGNPGGGASIPPGTSGFWNEEDPNWGKKIDPFGGQMGGGQIGTGTGQNGLPSITPSITPTNVYSQDQTQGAVNLARAQQDQYTLPWLLGQHANPGMSARSPGLAANRLPELAQHQGLSASAGLNIPFGDATANFQHILSGQQGRDQEVLGLANVLARLQESQVGAGNANFNSLLQMLDSLMR